MSSTTNQFVTGITLLLGAIGGGYLIQNVKREIKQRVEIEQLANKLEKANEKLRQIDKEKSEFVSIASHQLRSPLTAISGYASLIREESFGKLPERLKDPITRIERSARFMAESIEDFLNVSRIESGNMKYKLDDFNLPEVAKQLCDDLSTDALRKGLVLLFLNKLESHTGIVHADQGKVRQIIHNLINNATKYTPKGTIHVIARDDKGNKRIYLDIIDTGIGMNEVTLNSIFKKFERGQTGSTVNVMGTGLGLYIARLMADAMGGTITAHSEGEGQGSRFTLELPVVL